MPAHYRATIDQFLTDDANNIVGQLTRQAAAAGFYQQQHAQTDAWSSQIECLRPAALVVQSAIRDQGLPAGDGHILLEYPIPRRGKRVDCVLLVAGLVIVIEFKCGTTHYTNDAITQVEDYCLDLRDFHQQSAGRLMVPVLVATDAPAGEEPDTNITDRVTRTWRANAHNLGMRLAAIIARHAQSDALPTDASAWDNSNYLPTPTIIESAQALYAGQNVREISRCHAGVHNLTRTSEAVIQAINTARQQGRKLICFITGVPGAGKTLAGLNIVHNHSLHDGELGVFLSGNGPLVTVLRGALTRDHAARNQVSRAEAARQVGTFVQNVHHFIDTYYGQPTKVPPDRVVIFDEAQRAWDAAQSQRKFKRKHAEAHIMLESMDRHPDWAVIVALIGSGQEINRGEAGLEEWGRALQDHYRHWEVIISPELAVGRTSNQSRLFAERPTDMVLREEPALHLDVNLRSYRAEALSQFVAALLNLNATEARRILPELKDFPLLLTRDLQSAKAWLRSKQRGSRRTGLVASSGARRLRAYGLDVQTPLDVENWFLNDAADVRSSFYLETPATEFGIQGLELDWTGVCWGGDLSLHQGEWNCRAFRGTKWQKVNHQSTQRQYIINKYRVLLTRAREGTIIWVPEGDPRDHSRPQVVYDSVADYLLECGIPQLTN